MVASKPRNTYRTQTFNITTKQWQRLSEAAGPRKRSKLVRDAIDLWFRVNAPAASD